MLTGHTSPHVWDTRRTEKQRRLIAPGVRVEMEGNNQKQADFLSRMLAEVNPSTVHDLHMIMPSVGRSEHLDIFEKGIARKLDFAFSGPQSLRVSQLLKIGDIHTYIELYSRLFVDLAPMTSSRRRAARSPPPHRG